MLPLLAYTDARGLPSGHCSKRPMRQRRVATQHKLCCQNDYVSRTFDEQARESAALIFPLPLGEIAAQEDVLYLPRCGADALDLKHCVLRFNIFYSTCNFPRLAVWPEEYCHHAQTRQKIRFDR